MANLPANYQMRRTIARRVLRRGLPFLCRAFRPDDRFGLPAGADCRERDRCRNDNPRRLLHLVVQAAGRVAGNPASHGVDRFAFMSSQICTRFQAEICAFATVRPGGRRSWLTETATGIYGLAASNERETGKKLQIRRDNDHFSPKSRCRLSYQA